MFVWQNDPRWDPEMRFFVSIVIVMGGASVAEAQYAGSTIGVVATGTSANDELTLGGQYSLGIEGEHRMGVGNWKGTYRATVGYAQSFRTTGRSLFPARVDAGIRYDLLEDRRRPYFAAAFSLLAIDQSAERLRRSHVSSHRRCVSVTNTISPQRSA